MRVCWSLPAAVSDGGFLSLLVLFSTQIMFVDEQPDPHIFSPDNRFFYLTSTLNSIYSSRDLCTWSNPPLPLFDLSSGILDLWAPQIVMVGTLTVVTVTARLPWQCQGSFDFCRTSYFVVLARPLPEPGLTQAASGWVPIRTADLRIFRAAASCPLAANLPRSFTPGTFIPKRNLIGVGAQIAVPPPVGPASGAHAESCLRAQAHARMLTLVCLKCPLSLSTAPSVCPLPQGSIRTFGQIRSLEWSGSPGQRTTTSP